MLSMEQNILITKTIGYYGKEIPVENLCKWSDKKLQVRCPICRTTRWVYAKIYFISKNTICHKCGLKQRKKDLIQGSKYNRWTVLDIGKRVGFSKCQCECGTIKEVDNSSLLRGLSKSCGCLNIEQLQNMRKYLKIGTRYGRLVVKGHSEKAGYSICECDCGKVKDVSNILLKDKITQSCGCLQKHNLDNRRILKGKDHPNWKGGISGQRHSMMQTKVYKNWRTAIYKRDNHTCQKCKQIGYKLNVHHIKSYAEHENKRCDIDNGITLCHKCHLNFHKIYGRKNINETQLKEFLESKR
jgi:hypothetical protein